ncbi:peptidoglycan editing factor PgeF [Campylobacter mucosalis]|uniref:peptidoglycan editing factor PgeF n=1 Tax=Campylobacter mucosalis TaxID=202 RepID=UPI00146FF4AC|nr:peptidoglycan editing factor PgeF [Campylobacter mucosalis]
MGDGREIFEFVLNGREILAGFSTKEAGNLALHVGDEVKNVLQNRKNLCDFLGLDELKFMTQTHSDIVKILRHKDGELGECDAVITALRGVGICVMVADCSPILLYDRKNGVISAIHAGRAGVVSKIVTKTIALMQSEFGSQSSDINAFVGVNIKGSCYEIGQLNLGEFNKYKNGLNFDINLALKDEFESLGVTKFHFDKRCSHCDERFYSYRREKNTGRFAGVIALRG